MKLEDIRSEELRKSDADDFDLSDMRSSVGDFPRKSDLDSKDIFCVPRRSDLDPKGVFYIPRRSDIESKDLSTKDLYDISKQLRHIIDLIESGVAYNNAFKIGGISFNINATGSEFLDKYEHAKILNHNQEDLELKVVRLQQEIIQLKKKICVPNHVMNRFCDKVEEQMSKSFLETQFDFKNPNSPPKYIFNDNFSNKSRALMEYDYKKMKIHHQKCEDISSTLLWQTKEIQIFKNLLQKKLQNTLEKEAALNAKQQELTKIQKDYENESKTLESQKSYISNELENTKKYKRKLEKMKKMITSQIENFTKITKTTTKDRPTSTSRIESPTLKRIRYQKSLNDDSTSIDSQMENLQCEIKSLESLKTDSVDDTHQVHLSHLCTQLANLRSQKAIERNATNSGIHSVSKSTDKMFLPKRFNFSSVESSPNTTPIKVSKTNQIDNPSDPSKPPMYRKNTRGYTEPDTTAPKIPTITKSITIREERLAERELELEKKELELQQTWMKLPNAHDLIPMVQKQMLKLKDLKTEYNKKLEVLQAQISKYEYINQKIKQEPKKTDPVPELFVTRLKDLYSLIEELLL
jgi:hypothetical protein